MHAQAGQTAVALAAAEGHCHTVVELVRLGADMHAMNTVGHGRAHLC
jgi:hypothetical protein